MKPRRDFIKEIATLEENDDSSTGNPLEVDPWQDEGFSDADQPPLESIEMLREQEESDYYGDDN